MNFPDSVRDYFKATGADGGRARAKRLSATSRKAIASKAAHVMWAKHPERRKKPKKSA